MAIPKLTGQGSGVEKYDILTALSVDALQRNQRHQSSILRLMALITAHYNWRMDEVSIGRRELTSLWGVSEATVKREIGRLRDLGVLEIATPGVRGRVTTYRLNRQAIRQATRENWTRAGSAFTDRMSGSNEHEKTAPDTAGANILSFPMQKPAMTTASSGFPDHPCDRSRWKGFLAERYPAKYTAWFSKLDVEFTQDGTLRVFAGSHFVSTYVETHFQGLVLEAALSVWRTVMRVKYEIRPIS